jgi:soluble lytic murein transglycosylase
LEGAIYAETIPFNETREYVKKVLANAMFYQAQLGLPYVPLRDRLGIVPPRIAAASTGASSAIDTAPPADAPAAEPGP